MKYLLEKKEKWLKKYLELPNGIPSHDTIQRVISLLESQSLYSDAINYLIDKNGAKNLGIIRRIALAILKFVQTYYKKSLKLIRTGLSFDFENEIDTIFKLLDTETLRNLKNT